MSSAPSRHKKYGDSVYLREPNVKEGAGGLRDVHAALWIARMKHGTVSLEGLRDKGIIKDREYRRLRGCRDYLLRLRNELHFKAGHRQDVLTFDMQEEAARTSATAKEKLPSRRKISCGRIIFGPGASGRYRLR